MAEVCRYTFHVNSNKRSSGTATDMTLNFTNTLTLKAADSSFHIDVHAVNIPFSFYQLSADINTLSINITDETGFAWDTTVTLPIGNYTSITVLTALSSALITACQNPIGGTAFTPTLTFTYSSSTGKSTYVMASGALSQIRLDFNLDQNLGNFFGFITQQILSPSQSLLSNQVCVANPVNYLLVRSGNMQQTFNREYIVETDTFSDILYRVPVNQSTNTWLSGLIDTESIEVSNDNITNINLYLTTNLTYTPVDLQGVNWSISFSIIELLKPKFVPITTKLLSNLPVPLPQPEEDVTALEADLENARRRLDRYQSKLRRKVDVRDNTVDEKTSEEVRV
jgi:hypothetical protein